MPQVQESKQIGQDVHLLLNNVSEATISQRGLVDQAFARRVQETVDARARAQAELARTKESIWSQQSAIQNLEVSIEDKQRPLALTTTRLQTRTSRPSRENVRDKVHVDLVEEADLIDRAVSALCLQKDDAESNLGELQDAVKVLEEDLQVKKNSIAVDQSCMKRRSMAFKRKARVTDYSVVRSVKEWCSYGRARSVYIK